MLLRDHRRCPRVFIAAALILWCGQAEAGRLAVFRLDPLGIEPQIVARLEGLFRLELGRLADAAMPSEEEIEAALRRNPELQNCTGEVQCLTRAGKLLGVERIISGNVGGLGESYVLNLKIVEVETGRELRRIQEPISGRPDELIEAVRVAAYGLVAPERLRGALALLADQPGAEVRLDDRLVGRTPLATLHGIAVGPHALRVSKAGYLDVREQVTVRLQKTAQVVVKLQAPRPSRAPRQAPRVRTVPWYTRWWFWTIVGVAAAGAGAGLGFAIAGQHTGVNCEVEMSRCR